MTPVCPQADTLQVPLLLQEPTQFTAHAALVYVCEDAPEQYAPPPEGAGLVQVRV